MSIKCSRILIVFLVILFFSSVLCAHAEITNDSSDTATDFIILKAPSEKLKDTTNVPSQRETSIPLNGTTTENTSNITTTETPLNATTTKTTTARNPINATTTKIPSKPTTSKSHLNVTTTKTHLKTTTTKNPINATTTKIPFKPTTSKSHLNFTTAKTHLKTTTAKNPINATTTKKIPSKTTTSQSHLNVTTTKTPLRTTTSKTSPNVTTTKTPLRTTTSKTSPNVTTTKTPLRTTTSKTSPNVTTTKSTTRHSTRRATTFKPQNHTITSRTTPAHNQSSPVAKAKTGTYIGYWSVTRDGITYASFSGIRYVKPMTPLNRFKWAELVDDTHEVKEALEEGSDCPQWNIHRRSNKIVGNEDCLFMNIYTPSVKGKYPVMVVIPCGHFIFDSASRNLNGPDYFMNTQEIVMVIFNYRLGPLGFADFRSDKYPSNLGMKDQVLALKWVQRNIEGFGGDPRRVTIQGTSSGAVSVHYHMISPLSRGLFHAGISESGTALDPWSLTYPHKSRSLIIALASRTGCEWAVPVSTESSADAVAECFRNRSAHQLLAATRHVNLNLIEMLFVPVVEVSKFKPFLPEDPYLAAEHRLPWLTGQNSDETGIINSAEKPWYWLLRVYVSSICYEAIPNWLNYAETATDPWNVTATLLYHYGNTYKPSQSKIIPTLKKAGEDGVFWNPHYMSMLKHKATKYSYLFAYRQTTNKGTFLFPDRGVSHSEEQFYLFIKQGVDIQKQNPVADANMSKTLVRLWTNFIKYHNPTPVSEKVLPKWEKWTEKNNLFYTIDQDSMKMSVDPKLENYKFWETLPFRDKMPPFPFYPKNKTSDTSSHTNSSTSHKWHISHHKTVHSSSSSKILSFSSFIIFFILVVHNL